MSEYTTLDQLPSEPINLNIQETNKTLPQMIPQQNFQNSQNINTSSDINNLPLDSSTINQLINGIQEASLSGVTQLSSRDIPNTTMYRDNDPQIKPNYIPKVNQTQIDYINSLDDDNDNYYRKNSYHNNNYNNNLNNFYDEIQFPILIGVLYFLFQLPFFKLYFFKYLPILYNIDGNFNFYGLIFMSSLYSFVFYIFNKVIIKN